MKESLLATFFSTDPNEALRALPALAGEAGEHDRSHGAVTSFETLYSVRGEERLRAARNGIFSEVIFGPAEDDRCACGATRGEASRGLTCGRCGVLCDRASLRDERWGHVEVAGVVHPSVLSHLFEALGLVVEDLRDVVSGKKALRLQGGGEAGEEPGWVAAALDEDDGEELTGPDGLAEAVRRARPDHPLLPLCALTKVPVPPPGDRPLAPLAAPTQVDPWIGPLNEAWVTLVERAGRERRLIELDAPSLILREERRRVQEAFEVVVRQTQQAAGRLVPPLVRPPDDLEDAAVLCLAFAGPDRLIVQRRDEVSILDLSGHRLFRLPPAGTALRGVAAGRYAVFEGFFHKTHPVLAGTDSGFGPDLVQLDEDGTLRMARILGEISVIDCRTGAYLERPPPGLCLRFVTNDQPEDLFLTTAGGEPIRRLRFGGDRPSALAYAPGLDLAWVGEEGDSTEIIDLDGGHPHAYPAEPGRDDCPQWSLLAAAAGEGEGGEEGDEEDDDEDEYDQFSAKAVVFRDGAWHLLWSSGILCDHRARGAVRLDPLPEAAAFAPDGRTLAVIVRGTVVLADVVRREVIGRFPLPAP